MFGGLTALEAAAKVVDANDDANDANGANGAPSGLFDVTLGDFIILTVLLYPPFSPPSSDHCRPSGERRLLSVHAISCFARCSSGAMVA